MGMKTTFATAALQATNTGFLRWLARGLSLRKQWWQALVRQAEKSKNATQQQHYAECLLAENPTHQGALVTLLKLAYKQRNGDLVTRYSQQLLPLNSVAARYYQLLWQRYQAQSAGLLPQALALLKDAKQQHAPTTRQINQLVLELSIEAADDASGAALAEQQLLGFIHTYGVNITLIPVVRGMLQRWLQVGNTDAAKALHDAVVAAIPTPELKDYLGLKLADLAGHWAEESPYWQSVLQSATSSTMLAPQLFNTVAPLMTTLHSNSDAAFDVRLNGDDAAKVMCRIESALGLKTGLSLLRLGDGESYGFWQSPHSAVGTTVPLPDGVTGAMVDDDQALRETIWWREAISTDLKTAMQANFVEALANADVIGVPAIYRYLRDMPPPNELPYSSRSLRSIELVNRHLLDWQQKNRFAKAALFTEERCHQTLFTLPNIQQLASKASHVVVVSCFKAEAIRPLFIDVPVSTVVIPPHSRVANLPITANLKDPRPMPYQLDALAEQLADKCAPGVLVLVGGGFAGKHLLNVAKQHGAVALDVGAMVDYWLGLRTRGMADLV